MKRNINIWNAKGQWYRTTWWEKRRGGKRRFLKTVALLDGPEDSAGKG